jgi:hypothetical protein
MTDSKESNPKQYLIDHGRDLPYVEALINKQWKDDGIAYVILSKRMPDNKYIACLYAIDFLCTGLKKTDFFVSLSIEEYNQIISGFEKVFGKIEKSDIIFIHNLIYGSIRYAEKLGFTAQANFQFTEYLLDTDFIDEGIKEIEFGHLGKPLYVEFPNDDAEMIMKILDHSVGKGNYAYILRSGEEFDDIIEEGNDDGSDE